MGFVEANHEHLAMMKVGNMVGNDSDHGGISDGDFRPVSLERRMAALPLVSVVGESASLNGSFIAF